MSKNSDLSNLDKQNATILSNKRCCYCGIILTKNNKTNDHVIGRRFVPKGKLNKNWNLRINSCQLCNNRKSNLEDDIAAITLLPDLIGNFPHNDTAAIEESHRRAEKSISRRTKKPVGESAETLKVKAHIGQGINIIGDFSAPPQIDEARAFELARLQLSAFFFLLCYKEETNEGGWWRHGYHPVRMATNSDWGNPILRGFATLIKQWDPIFHLVTADGFFKTIIRRHPSAECWAWAIEWNKSRRLIGFFGERTPAQQIVNILPHPKLITVFSEPGRSLSYHVETPLSEEDDILFPSVESDDK